MEEDRHEMFLSFEDVAQYMFEGLTELGYVPESDELLNITDLVVELIMSIHVQMGGEIEVMLEEEEEE